MKFGKALKKTFGKKKGSKRRNAGLGAPQDALQDTLGSASAAPALNDALVQPPAQANTEPKQAPDLPWKRAQNLPRPQAKENFGSRRKYKDVKSRETEYDGEFEHATWRGDAFTNAQAKGFNINTQKASESEFDSRYKVGVGDGGMLTGADGEVLDSSGAISGRGTEGLLTYAMNPDGAFGTADAGAETTRGSDDYRAYKALSEEERNATDAPDYSVFHHSSFFGDDQVAAAGEMKVREGTLKEIDNNTGHFKTRDSQTVQALDELKGRGANLDHANVNLRDFDNLDKTTNLPAQTHVPASAFMQSGGNAEAHWAKANLNSSILQLGGMTAMSEASNKSSNAEKSDLVELLEDFLEDHETLPEEQLDALMHAKAAELGMAIDWFDADQNLVSAEWAHDGNGSPGKRSAIRSAVAPLNSAKADEARLREQANAPAPSEASAVEGGGDAPLAYSPLGYANAPLAYSPLGYANAPTEYSDAPLGNAPTEYSNLPLGNAPTEYSNLPLGNTPTEYSDMPLGNTPTEYSDMPLGYSETPLGYSEAPLGYSEAPLSYSEAPLGYSEAPLGYSETPLGYSKAPLGYSTF